MKRPFIFINSAITADGKLATANRKTVSFGSKKDLEHLYELRTTADAVMSGARTIEESGATLGNGGERFQRKRVRDGKSEYPLRIVVTGSATISTSAPIWEKRFSPIIVLTSQQASPERLDGLKKLATEVWVSPGREIDIGAALEYLYLHHGVRRLLCEGGGGLNDALFRAGVVDELHLTICPYVCGGHDAPSMSDGVGIGSLAEARGYEMVKRRRIGDEMFLVYRAPEPEMAGV